MEPDSQRFCPRWRERVEGWVVSAYTPTPVDDHDASLKYRKANDANRSRPQDALHRRGRGRGRDQAIFITLSPVIIGDVAVSPDPTLRVAQEAPRCPSLEALEKIIETRTPETRVVTPDHDRIITRGIDVVDADGTIRMTLATPCSSI